MLEKNNIKLRAPEPEDIEFLFEIENNSDYWHVTKTHNPFSRFDIEQYILLADKDIYTAQQLRFIIDLKGGEKKQSIGTIDVFDFNAHDKRAGIGISIIESMRQKGYAGIALDILIEYMFVHLNMHQLYCNIESDNKRSIGLFESRGFVAAGVKKDWNLRSNNWIDEHFFQLIKTKAGKN